MRRLLALLLIAGTPAWATDADTTWDGTEWNTPWTDASVSGACDTTNDFAYSATDGNTAECRKRTCVGRNDSSVSRRIEWAGTWEDLGVTPGDTVSTVQMLDLDTKVLTYSTCNGVTFGPFVLADAADATVATLWSGRSSTTAEGSFTAEGAQTAQSVGSLAASDSSIQLFLTVLTSTANDAAATCTGVVDNLDIRVVHSTGGGTRRVMIIGTRFDGEGFTVKSKS